MQKRIADARRALRENRGSGVMLVLIAVFFVVILSATLLYLSYTGHLVRLTGQQSTDNFYDASTVMDEITAGVQNVTSDAITKAYTEVLKQYSQLDDPSITFDALFQQEMLQNDLISTLGGGMHQYSTKTLYEYVDEATLPADAAFTVNGYNGEGLNVLGNVTADGDIVLRGVTVHYTCNGYETNVSADICVALPDFYKYDNETQSVGLPDYALVAKGGLTVTSGSTQIDANAYVGRVNLTTGSLGLGDGTTTVVAGDVKVFAGSNALTQSGTNSLWAENMIAGNGANVLLGGKTYLADDLELQKNAAVTLGGELYGFGTSSTNPAQSSAIISNGTGAKLDLTEARRLFLAGVSFIGSEANAVSGISMSESIASKADQRLYLVPESAIGHIDGNLTGGNPWVTVLSADEATRSAQLSAYADAVTIPANMRAYSASVVPMAYPVGGDQYVVYLFWSFPSEAQANAYFLATFQSNQTLASTYINQYLTVIARAQSQQTHGYGVSGSGAELTLTDPYAASLSTQAGRYGGWFDNLRISLTTSAPATSGRDNPFDYYVNTDKVNAATALNATGTIGDGSYLITNTDVSVSAGHTWDLIITAGNVTVTGDYEGMILCGGTITVTGGAHFTAGTKATTLLASGDVAQYLRGYTANEGGDITDTRKTWALDELVHYENWSKN